jgi:N-acetyl-1-D-myo-inositol-2-amino-2-deoxy-alpha-D-glucopyranoside deacetylase/mycothiol S-conjugate amidase
VAEKVVGHIRRLMPQVVITFDPVGGYHHPDHIAIHKATLRAFHAAGDARQFPKTDAAFTPEKLYYNALSRRGLRRMVRVMKLTGKDPSKMGRNKDIDLTVLIRDPDTPPHVSINYKSVEDRRKKAVACHASQLGGFPRLSVLDLYYKLVGRKDNFTRAYPPATDDFRAKDLFA